VVEYGYVYRDGGGMFFEHGAPTVQNNITYSVTMGGNSAHCEI
jgi:hypothetical protein